jgi:hypothetical protein
VLQAIGSTYIERHEVVETHMTSDPVRRRSTAGRALRRLTRR